MKLRHWLSVTLIVTSLLAVGQRPAAAYLWDLPDGLLASDPKYGNETDTIPLRPVVGDKRDALQLLGMENSAGKNKQPHGLGNVRVQSGGRERAWQMFMDVLLYDELKSNVVRRVARDDDNYPSTTLPTAPNPRNYIVCGQTFDISKDNQSGTVKIKSLYYQEHAATGLAWIQYTIWHPKTLFHLAEEQRHRLIFLNRQCPDGDPNTCSDHQATTTPITSKNATDVKACIAVVGQPTPVAAADGREEGGGGGEM